MERIGNTIHISEVLILEKERLMSSRRARQLPIIDIGGTDFYLDLKLHEFREVGNWANKIDLDDLYETANGQYKCWFDKEKKNLFLGSQVDFEAATNAVEITLPSQQDMDPLGFLWLMEDQGWVTSEEANYKTEQLLSDYHIDAGGMILQRKQAAVKPKLIEKRPRVNKQRKGKRL